MTQKMTQNDITKRVNNIWGTEFYVTNYVNSHELFVKDSKTQQEYKVTVANFLTKRHDPRKNILKKNKIDIQKEISSIYGDEFIISEYTNANNIIIVDKNNCKYHTTYSHLIKERKNPHNYVNKYSIEEIKTLIMNKSNNTLSIIGTYNGMKNKLTLKCNICGNIFSTQPTHIIHEGTKCPFCSHVKISKETCILNSPYKYKFERFLTEEQMLNYMPHSMQKIVVTCPICKQTKLIAPDTIFQQNGIGCICGDGISYPNKFMYNFLDQCNIDFEREKTFQWSNNRIYDFYIKSKNIIIEMNGLQHYKDYQFKNNRLYKVQQNDKYKKELAIKNLHCTYIEIDASKSNLEFIKNNIIKSNLLTLLSIDKNIINFEECDKFAIKHTILISLVEEFNKNKDKFNIKQFACNNKISLSLTYKILNQAIQHSLITGYKLKNTYKKKVKCVETGEIYNSIVEANKKCHANIGKALKKHSLANNCHWEIIE